MWIDCHKVIGTLTVTQRSHSLLTIHIILLLLIIARFIQKRLRVWIWIINGWLIAQFCHWPTLTLNPFLLICVFSHGLGLLFHSYTSCLLSSWLASPDSSFLLFIVLSLTFPPSFILFSCWVVSFFIKPYSDNYSQCIRLFHSPWRYWYFIFN